MYRYASQLAPSSRPARAYLQLSHHGLALVRQAPRVARVLDLRGSAREAAERQKWDSTLVAT